MRSGMGTYGGCSVRSVMLNFRDVQTVSAVGMSARHIRIRMRHDSCTVTALFGKTLEAYLQFFLTKF